MSPREIYDLALSGGGNDFQAVVELLERLGEPWCLIGGLAVNAYVEPVYTADADFVVIANQLEFVCAELAGLGFLFSTTDSRSMRTYPARASLCNSLPTRVTRISWAAPPLRRPWVCRAGSLLCRIYSKASFGLRMIPNTAR